MLLWYEELATYIHVIFKAEDQIPPSVMHGKFAEAIGSSDCGIRRSELENYSGI